MSLMSDNLRNAIWEQIAHEMLNANIYLHMCGFLRNKGLDNIAKHFEGQHTEETGHAKEFFNLLTDLNADVQIPEIGEVSTSFGLIGDLANTYLQRELLTTTSINEIKKLAIQEDNSVVEEKMREMIAKQQHEYEEANTFLDKTLLMPEWWQWAIHDGSLG